jgi:hypothetical protein
MEETTDYAPTTETGSPTRTIVRLVAIQAALAAAAIHLYWAIPKLLVYLPIGSFADPRPYLFVPSALILLGVATAEAKGIRSRRLYALAIGVLLTYALGYVWWHLGDHGGLFPGHHSAHPVQTVVSHLLDDPLAFAAMFVELIGAAAFGALFVGDGDE